MAKNKAWDQLPQGWESLSVSAIDLGDIIGAPRVTARESANRASGAFATATRQLGPDEGLQVFARRELLLDEPPSVAALRRAPSVAAQVLPAKATEGRADLREVHQLVSASGTHVVMQQQLRGHDVVGGRVVLHVDAERAYAMSGQPVGDLGQRALDSPPPAEDDRVRAAVRRHFSVVPRSRLRVRLVVLPSTGECRWAWFVKVPVAEPRADIRVFLEPGSLEILLAYPASAAAYGEASVFPVNPLRTPDEVGVALTGIGETPGDVLQGPLVHVTGPGGPWAVPDRNFTVASASPRFDEAAAFYFVTEALRYFGGLAHDGLLDAAPFRPLQVLVHDGESPNNAYFHPDSGTVKFGDFLATGASSARSFDMVLHEVGHAVTHAIARLSDTPSQETRGLSEGYSDYFACSRLDRPEFGDYVMQVKAGARNCAKPALKAAGPLGDYEEHDLGEIWANVLWGIRSRLGPSVTDALVMESLYFAQSARSIEAGVGALRMADAALFPDGASGTGRHAAVIDGEYAQRF